MKNQEFIETPKQVVEKEEERDSSCQLCSGASQCNQCDEGLAKIKAIEDANAGKPIARGKLYKKVGWEFNPQSKDKNKKESK